MSQKCQQETPRWLRADIMASKYALRFRLAHDDSIADFEGHQVDTNL